MGHKESGGADETPGLEPASTFSREGGTHSHSPPPYPLTHFIHTYVLCNEFFSFLQWFFLENFRAHLKIVQVYHYAFIIKTIFNFMVHLLYFPSTSINILTLPHLKLTKPFLWKVWYFFCELQVKFYRFHTLSGEDQERVFWLEDSIEDLSPSLFDK